jgi:hypothetical protein
MIVAAYLKPVSLRVSVISGFPSLLVVEKKCCRFIDAWVIAQKPYFLSG